MVKLSMPTAFVEKALVAAGWVICDQKRFHRHYKYRPRKGEKPKEGKIVISLKEKQLYGNALISIFKQAGLDINKYF